MITYSTVAQWIYLNTRKARELSLPSRAFRSPSCLMPCTVPIVEPFEDL